MRIYFVSLLLLPLLSSAQEAPEVLQLKDYYLLVRQYHPIARQATLIKSRGEASVSEARGAFDPKLISAYNAKQFEDKNYYDIWDSYVEVPTLLNVDLKAGYERNSGIFLNRERNIPNDGLYYAGVSVPVGEGLFVNERAIGLKKGKLTREEMTIESEGVLNNLFLDANYAYWNWYEALEKQAIVRSNLDLVGVRFEGIRQGVLNGENAAIDSVETLIQVQQWTNYYQKAIVDFENSKLLLENFLWEEELDLNSHQPADGLESQIVALEFYTDFASSNHPDLRRLSIQAAKLDLDKRLNAEQIKPTINLNYNLLLSENNNLESTSFLSNNYKAGIDFSFPLFVRKERAKLKMANLKRQENDLKINQKRRSVNNKVNQTYNKVIQVRDMIAQQQQMIENYEVMLNGERIKFNNGESSIFLINSRENKKLEAELKLIELISDYGRAIGELKWSSGILQTEIINSQ